MKSYIGSLILILLVVLASACSPAQTQTNVPPTDAPTTVPPTIIPSATAIPPSPTPTLDLGPVELLWSASGGPNPLNTPSGLALDARGNVYVVDTLNHQIRVFNAEGNEVATWGELGNGEGQFNFAWKENLNADEADEVFASLTLDNTGNIYVADVGNARIQKLDEQGNFLAQWPTANLEDGAPSQAYDLVVDSQGNIYTLDLQSVVSKYDKDGNLLSRWGGIGITEDRFTEADQMTIDASDNLYVSDSKRESIVKFDANGQMLARFHVPVKEGGDARNATPAGIALDPQGNIYTTDYLSHRVVVLDSNGQFLREWGRQGKDAGLLYGPADIAIDSEGNIYISEKYNHRVQKFRLVEN